MSGIADRGSDCPVCGEAVAESRAVDPVTYVLEPCGHQVDDAVYRDVVAE